MTADSTTPACTTGKSRAKTASTTRTAHARPGEHDLDDEGAAEHVREVDADHRRQRHGGVAERVAPDDGAFRQTHHPAGADVVAVQDVEHRRAQGARHRRDRVPAEGDRRQHEVKRTLAAEGRQPLKPDRQVQDEQQADPEARHRLAEQSQHLCQTVDPAASVDRRQHTQGHGQEKREDEPGQRQLERCRQPLQQQRHRRRLPLIGLAEVAAERVAQEDDELDRQGPVEPQGLAHRREVLLRSVHRQQQGDRVAGQALRHEDDQERAEHRHRALPETADQVGAHRSAALSETASRPPGRCPASFANWPGARARSAACHATPGSRAAGRSARRRPPARA